MSDSVCDGEFLRRQNNKLKEKAIHQERLIESLMSKSLTSDETTGFPVTGDVLPSINDAVTIRIGLEDSLVKTIDLFIDSLAKKTELHEQDKVFLTSFLTGYLEKAEQ